MKRLRAEGGYTLAEFAVAATLSVLMSLGVLMFVAMFERSGHQYQGGLANTERARLALNKMVTGTVDAGTNIRQGLWEAQGFNILSATHLQYTDSEGVVHELQQDGLNIRHRILNDAWVTIYDPNGADPDDDRFDTEISFTQAAQPNVVQIQITLGENISGRWDYASASTKVAFRN